MAKLSDWLTQHNRSQGLLPFAHQLYSDQKAGQLTRITLARGLIVVTNENSTLPSWIDVKAALQNFDRAGLLGLLQDLYAGSKDNQAFLHARLSLGRDQLKPYKTAISNWICPNLTRNKPVSVSKAKRAIADYKRAIGQPEGLIELSIFYCEKASAFSNLMGWKMRATFSL